MKLEIEKALRVKSISQDILEQLMQDRVSYQEEDLKNVAEMLVRSVSDLVNIYAGLEEDHDTSLKGTISKMKIGYNTLHLKKKTLENESV